MAAPWVAGFVGLLLGVAALASLIAALLSPYWASVSEPIVLSETSGIDYHYGALMDDYNYGGPMGHENLQPLVTTVTFKLGLWKACPNINTTGIHISEYFIIFKQLYIKSSSKSLLLRI